MSNRTTRINSAKYPPSRRPPFWKKTYIHANDVYGRNSQPSNATNLESQASYQLLKNHPPTKNNRGLISNNSTTRQPPPRALSSYSVSQSAYDTPLSILPGEKVNFFFTRGRPGDEPVS
jgi:hypothetical protein